MAKETKQKAVEPVKATPQPQPKAPTLPPPTQAFKASPVAEKIEDTVAIIYTSYAAQQEDQNQWPDFDMLDALTQANYLTATLHALHPQNEARTTFEQFVKKNYSGKQIL